MPELVCPCGFRNNLSPIPDDGWLTVRDRDHDAMSVLSHRNMRHRVARASKTMVTRVSISTVLEQESTEETEGLALC
jgi:hypothetical protein